MKMKSNKKQIFLCLLSCLFVIVGCSFPLSAQQSEPVRFVLNQVGYQPDWPKNAFLLNAANSDPNDPDASEVTVVDLNTKAVVLHQQPSPAHRDPDTNLWLQTVDFSELRASGSYILKRGGLQSSPFQIGENVYDNALITLLRSYYLQRCGVTLDDPMTGLYHPPCHRLDGQLSQGDFHVTEGTALSAQGGWHDAGDYGKYVATAAVTIGRILSLYEQVPTLFHDGQLSIPESGSGQPDVLDEMAFGLDWMVRMQRRDGGVYRKLSGQEWPIGKAPHEDTQPRLVYGISTPETAKFAAVMAMAARIYQPFDSALSQNYLDSAVLAWDYLQQHPEMEEGWQAGDDSGSGKYLYSEIDNEASLKTDGDDRLWAAVELWLTTGDSSYDAYLSRHLQRQDYGLFEWKNPAPLALSDYLFQSGDRSNKRIKSKITKKIIGRADQLLKTIKKDRFRLANQRFIWGSNKMVAEEGITLLYAYQLTQKHIYRDAAIEQLDYLLGRNPFNQTFVTGLGERPVQNVNHLFSRAKGVHLPGLFVGGPNSAAQDNVAPKNKGILSYLDSEKSYATNEYAIDYNASLIGLIGLLAQS